MTITLTHEDVIKSLKPIRRAVPLAGMISIFREVEENDSKYMARAYLRDFAPTQEFLRTLKTVKPVDDGVLVITWEISPRLLFTLRFDRNRLLSCEENSYAAVKTEYAELYAFYDNRNHEIELDSSKSEFIVFRKHLRCLPPALYRNAVRVA